LEAAIALDIGETVIRHDLMQLQEDHNDCRPKSKALKIEQKKVQELDERSLLS
tara:strand:+ start:2668 stop:2826 length:159 start_codon:yes stop_codon:yes gene_type:complete